jgi:tetratricopeptide (TPR) repeat protein
MACTAMLFAQQTPNGWRYENIRKGTGSYLQASQGALTHNQLIDDSGNIMVSTYQIGVPDYQLIAELSPAFQQAFSIMQEGGKYIFHIPVEEFKQAAPGSSTHLSGKEVHWEMELINILPPLPDGARKLAQILQKKSTDEAYQAFMDMKSGGKAYFGEWETNQAGYMFLSEGEAERALSIFLMNVKDHPQSANAHDSLAEAYYQSGNTQSAKKHYKQSLLINPDNENARQMLDKL